MRQNDEPGTVMVTTIVDSDGIPCGTDVLIPFRRPFDAAAIDATNLMRFEPAVIGGVAVPVRIFVEFSFSGGQAAALPRIVERGNRIVPPVARNSVWVAYPRRARKLRQKGILVISFVVTRHGRPADLRLVRSAGEALDMSAVRAVQRLRFKPATMDGQPVAAHVTIEMRFNLFP